MILHFLSYILDTLEEASLEFQKRYGLLIQQAVNLKDLIQTLKMRAVKPGSNVIEALSKKCVGGASTKLLKNMKARVEVTSLTWTATSLDCKQ